MWLAPLLQLAATRLEEHVAAALLRGERETCEQLSDNRTNGARETVHLLLPLSEARSVESLPMNPGRRAASGRTIGSRTRRRPWGSRARQRVSGRRGGLDKR
jgi:hypothetical protein